LAWLLSKPYVTSPIIGATKPQHLEDAIASLTVRLTADEIAALEAPYVPHATAGFE
jgi:aryl-alcohol dehydrogenase-like predicted oxidoreductase